MFFINFLKTSTHVNNEYFGIFKDKSMAHQARINSNFSCYTLVMCHFNPFQKIDVLYIFISLFILKHIYISVDKNNSMSLMLCICSIIHQ